MKTSKTFKNIINMFMLFSLTFYSCNKDFKPDFIPDDVITVDTIPNIIIIDNNTIRDDTAIVNNYTHKDKNTLYAGEYLEVDSFLISDNNAYKMKFIGNNLLIYNNKTGYCHWRLFNALLPSNGCFSYYTPSIYKTNRLRMMENGVLEIVLHCGQVFWDSKTHNQPGSRLVLENDGKLLIYNSNNKIIWESDFSNRLYSGQELKINQYIESDGHNFQLYFKSDGNLVLIESGGYLNWNSGSIGASKCLLLSDGNLVLSDPTGNTLWQSNTSGENGKYYLEVAEDYSLGRWCHIRLFNDDGTMIKEIF